MAILVILILAVLWAAVLVPPILRSRSESSAAPGGVGDFVARLSAFGRGQQGQDRLPSMAPLQPIMGPVGGMNGSGLPSPMGPVRVPGGMSPAQRRRRDVLVGFLAAAGLTFLMAFTAQSIVMWVVHLLADALLGGYIILLLQFKQRNVEQRAKVRPIRQAPRLAPVPAYPVSHVGQAFEAPVLQLRRTGSY